MSTPDQNSSKTGNRSLKTLQHSALDRDNLVGRPSKSLKHQLSRESPPSDGEVKRKNISSKETQVNIENSITAEELINPEEPSENYWKILAVKRQLALKDALDENEKLLKIIQELKEENVLYKQMLDEANSFVEVIKEELANSSNNDTGIDVNDVSTADYDTSAAEDAAEVSVEDADEGEKTTPKNVE